ncbi:hypothetical protein SNR37_002225 [Agarivorans aestuarii]|uniref:Class I SAM-dependent methyltransferase n=1 Tax=Agarivorans aestuarii TaxID=1563703 RepID=A0ABU7G0M8_9ALTE|nr:hypothetical protein [Agarivorans aestuarii]MEE1672815.1 hypothetical protein [Agarivorans aestuarii]
MNRNSKGSEPPFSTSEAYWEQRYASGRNSGVGSYKKFAKFKAEFINSIVEKYQLKSVIEFGCGDGNQLSLGRYPNYLGFDVSLTALALCKEKFLKDANKSFKHVSDYSNDKADLTLSLDVIYHLVENSVYEDYMKKLFEASTGYVIIYSSNFESDASDFSKHVKHRKFTDWVQNNCPGWTMIDTVKNIYPYTGNYKTGTLSDFFVFKKRVV